MTKRPPPNASELGSILCLAIAAGTGCSDSNDSAPGARDAGAGGGDAALQDSGWSEVVDSGAHDAASTADAQTIDAETSDAATAPAPITATYVYQGGYGDNPYPFRTFQLNRSTGALSQVGGAKDLGPDPTYIAPSGDGRFLYVANESSTGGVTAASIGADGTPTKLETQAVENFSSPANYMVFTSLSPDGKYVLAASYAGGSAYSFPVQANGSLGSPVSLVAYGNTASTHSVRVDRSGRFAYAPNKDANNIGQMEFTATTGALSANTPGTIAGAPAAGEQSQAGPRHIALHPSKDLAYVANELNNTITAYRIQDNGTLEEIETETSLPAGSDGENNTGAHVLVHPNGKFVYMSNRGQQESDNTLAVFAIADNGSLSLVEHEPARGLTPRNFDIDSEGELMVVANQGSGNLAVFRIAADGRLSPLGELLTGLMSPAAVSIVNVRAN